MRAHSVVEKRPTSVVKVEGRFMPGTRVVIRSTEQGTDVRCAFCRDLIKFVAKQRRGRHVIVNVYVTESDANLQPGEGEALQPGQGGVWDRVIHYHSVCYEEAGEPYGPPAAAEWQPEVRQQRRRVAAQ